MEAGIKEFLGEIKIGAKQSHKNMTLYCLLSAKETTTDFLTLDEALEKHSLIITEVTEGGSVPQLKVINRSDEKILLMDGEELVGAKQNRVLNATILIAPQSETVIPVSCVEQGRWSYKGKNFGSESRAMSAQLKKRKSETVTANLRHGISFQSDQGVVWQEIDRKYSRMAAEPSPTMAMADLYESHKDRSNDFMDSFCPTENQIGMIIFIDGQVVGMELVAKFGGFKKVHSKLVNSYVMDALETVNHEKPPQNRAAKGKASKFIEAIRDAKVEARRSVALGNDLRLDSSEIMGAGLEFERQVLQLSIFMREDGKTGSRGSRMARAPQRRGA